MSVGAADMNRQYARPVTLREFQRRTQVVAAPRRFGPRMGGSDLQFNAPGIMAGGVLTQGRAAPMTKHEETSTLSGVGSTDVLERVELTEVEHAWLIRGTSHERSILCAFGPGGTTLLPVESNRWAFNIIKMARRTEQTRDA